MTKRIVIFWIANEVLQYLNFNYGFLSELFLLKFLNIHLSSLFGGFIFCELFHFLNIKKLIFVIPILQLIYDLSKKNGIDLYDLVFVSVGILIWIFNKNFKSKITYLRS